MKDFLNARAMLTPGVAGATVTLFTSALAGQFRLPPNWTALALSFLCGLVVLGDSSLAGVKRIIFYVINSLVIFTAAVGANGVGIAASGLSSGPRTASASPAPAMTPTVSAAEAVHASPSLPELERQGREIEQRKFFRPWFHTSAPSAYARPIAVPSPSLAPSRP